MAAETPIRAPFGRGEVYALVALSAVLVGLFQWTGIVHLDKASLEHWHKGAGARQAILTNQRAICAAVKATCTFPSSEVGK